MRMSTIVHAATPLSCACRSDHLVAARLVQLLHSLCIGSFVGGGWLWDIGLFTRLRLEHELDNKGLRTIIDIRGMNIRHVHVLRTILGYAPARREKGPPGDAARGPRGGAPACGGKICISPL